MHPSLAMDPPERQENPYAVSISAENETDRGEMRIKHGDILRLQINSRNRTYIAVSGHLLLRMREGTILVLDKPIAMPGKPLGGDDRRQKLHSLRVRVVHGESSEVVQDSDLLTLTLEPGRRTMQAYLLDGRHEMARGSRIIHFESEPPNTERGLPFEPFLDRRETPPMWELRMEKNRLLFAPDYPLNSA